MTDLPDIDRASDVSRLGLASVLRRFGDGVSGRMVDQARGGLGVHGRYHRIGREIVRGVGRGVRS